jgi:hypothetical protein
MRWPFSNENSHCPAIEGRMLRSLVQPSSHFPSLTETDPATVIRYYARFHESFLHYSEKELAKINTFFSGKLDVLR